MRNARSTHIIQACASEGKAWAESRTMIANTESASRVNSKRMPSTFNMVSAIWRPAKKTCCWPQAPLCTHRKTTRCALPQPTSPQSVSSHSGRALLASDWPGPGRRRMQPSDCVLCSWKAPVAEKKTSLPPRSLQDRQRRPRPSPTLLSNTNEEVKPSSPDAERGVCTTASQMRPLAHCRSMWPRSCGTKHRKHDMSSSHTG